MKPAILLALLSLGINTAYAAENSDISNDDIKAYCEEQTQLAGIEDANEMSKNTQECIDSFKAIYDDTTQPDQ